MTRDEELEQKKADIKRARKWAKAHWSPYIDEETTPSTLVDRQRHSVEFPDVDRLTVKVIMYGQPIDSSEARYRLAWLPEGVAWVGGFVIRPDIEAKLFIDGIRSEEQERTRKALMTYAMLGMMFRAGKEGER